jgi:hypothetical protein
VVSPKDGGRGRRQRAILDSIETILTMRYFPSFTLISSVKPRTLQASSTAPHFIAEPRAIAKNLALSFAETFPQASAMFSTMDSEALFN